MGVCRFEVKNIILFHFRLTVLRSFRYFACVSTKDDSLTEFRLANEFSNYLRASSARNVIPTL